MPIMQLDTSFANNTDCIPDMAHSSRGPDSHPEADYLHWTSSMLEEADICPYWSRQIMAMHFPTFLC